jgi:hypothetical protein
VSLQISPQVLDIFEQNASTTFKDLDILSVEARIIELKSLSSNAYAAWSDGIALAVTGARSEEDQKIIGGT